MGVGNGRGIQWDPPHLGSLYNLHIVQIMNITIQHGE